MHYSSDDIKEAFCEKLNARIGKTPSFNDVRSEFPSDAILIKHLINGDIKLDGISTSTTICKHRFEQNESLEYSQNNEIEE